MCVLFGGLFSVLRRKSSLYSTLLYLSCLVCLLCVYLSCEIFCPSVGHGGVVVFYAGRVEKREEEGEEDVCLSFEGIDIHIEGYPRTGRSTVSRGKQDEAEEVSIYHAWSAKIRRKEQQHICRARPVASHYRSIHHRQTERKAGTKNTRRARHTAQHQREKKKQKKRRGPARE